MAVLELDPKCVKARGHLGVRDDDSVGAMKA